jgi:hypothetical protein
MIPVNRNQPRSSPYNTFSKVLKVVTLAGFVATAGLSILRSTENSYSAQRDMMAPSLCRQIGNRLDMDFIGTPTSHVIASNALYCSYRVANPMTHDDCGRSFVQDNRGNLIENYSDRNLSEDLAEQTKGVFSSPVEVSTYFKTFDRNRINGKPLGAFAQKNKIPLPKDYIPWNRSAQKFTPMLEPIPEECPPQQHDDL